MPDQPDASDPQFSPENDPMRKRYKQAKAEWKASLASVARCPEHGLHGERTECFVCGGPVEQVSMVPAAERDKLRSALVAVRSMIDPHNPCHDGIREVLLDALSEDDS